MPSGIILKLSNPSLRFVLSIPEGIMEISNSDPCSDKLEQALFHLETGLELLDTANAAAHIGAHLDLAIHHLRAEILSPPIIENIPQVPN